MNNLDQAILNIVNNEKGRPISKKLLISKIQKINPNFEVKEIFKSLRYLANNFLISYNQLGKIKEGYKDGNIIAENGGEGLIFINNIGDGFIRIEDSTVEYYVNKKNLKGSLSGDKVNFAITDKISKKEINDAIITKVIERNSSYFVGTITITNGRVYCDLDDYKVFQKIVIVNPSQLVDGHKVWVKALEFYENEIKAEVVKVIGHKNDVGIDISSIVYGYGINPEFSNEVINEVNQISKIISSDERKRRVDLTNLPIITIDPATSKDLDDAVCVTRDKKDFKLYVSIADVSHYVKTNTLVDDEAKTRATSIYLIDKVIPMLPHVLSNDICSLNPHEDRLTMTCEMTIKENGDFGEIKVYDSIINSKHRFAYDDINLYIKDGTKDNQVDQNIWEMIDDSLELFKVLRNNLVKRGYIDFEIKEPKIELNQNGKVKNISSYERGQAQMMIENFMIAANEAVTIFFNNKFEEKPFVYRIHDKPNESKLNYFLIESKKMGFAIKGDVFKIKPNNISDWVRDNNFQEPKKTILNKLLLKTMSKAEYSTKNIGHFGLASEQYTHFTSPIRRYPDVLVHRLFKMLLTDQQNYKQSDLELMLTNLVKDCENASQKEVQAVSIERDVNSLKFCEFMETKIGEKFDGIITHVMGNGIFVELTNLIEGMVRISNIKVNDFFVFDKEKNILIGEKTKTIISFGMKVQIIVTNVNVKLKQIDFSLLAIIK